MPREMVASSPAHLMRFQVLREVKGGEVRRRRHQGSGVNRNREEVLMRTKKVTAADSRCWLAVFLGMSWGMGGYHTDTKDIVILRVSSGDEQ